MGSPSSIITLGLGAWGSPSLIVTSGFGIGAAVDVVSLIRVSNERFTFPDAINESFAIPDAVNESFAN